MRLDSLGYRTDLIFSRFAGEVQARGDYLVIRTPSNPTYYWGNFLIFSHAPQEGDYTRWLKLFAQEIGIPPTVNHVALGWNNAVGEQGDYAPFFADGFVLEESVVLTARQVVFPPKYNSAIEARILTTDEEWEQATQSQIECREAEHSLESYTVFKRAQMASYRAMARQGIGQWFGAFVDGEFAGDLGVFVENGVGRFQAVGTKPEFQRRGVCSTLVYEAAQYALKSLGANVLVMVADANYHAAQIYESVGFHPAERQTGLQRTQKR